MLLFLVTIMDKQTKVEINTCSRSELLRLPGVGNKIVDKILQMRKEGVQFNKDKLAKVSYLVTSPQLFEMVDYTTMVADIDFTDLDLFKMFHKLNKFEEPRETKSEELFSQTVSALSRQGESLHPVSVSGPTQVYNP